MKSRGVTRFLVISFLFVGLGSGTWLASQSSFFWIEELEVAWLEEPSAEVEKLSELLIKDIETNLQDLYGQNIFKLDVDTLTARLMKRREVDQVVIERSPPQTLRVKIKLKTISAVAMSEKGILIPISKEAQLLNPVTTSLVPDKPVVSDARIWQNNERRKKMVDLLSQIPEEGLLSQKSISEILADDKEDFWITLIEKGTKVKLGKESVEVRAARVEKVLDYLERNNMQARVIDADYPKKVVVKLRKGR